MNITTAIALYASVCKELGEDILYPGNEDMYLGWDSFTSNKLHAGAYLNYPVGLWLIFSARSFQY
jgi:hypothetical protein